MPEKSNVLFVMTDQQRFDTIAALGRGHIHTPNIGLLLHPGNRPVPNRMRSAETRHSGGHDETATGGSPARGKALW